MVKVVDIFLRKAGTPLGPIPGDYNEQLVRITMIAFSLHVNDLNGHFFVQTCYI